MISSSWPVRSPVNGSASVVSIAIDRLEEFPCFGSPFDESGSSFPVHLADPLDGEVADSIAVVVIQGCPLAC
jgi:hypothetical protein